MVKCTRLHGCPVGMPSSFKVVWLRPSWIQPGKWSTSHPPPFNNLERQFPSIKPKAPQINISSFRILIVRFLNNLTLFRIFDKVGKPFRSWRTCPPACVFKFSPSTSPKFAIFHTDFFFTLWSYSTMDYTARPKESPCNTGPRCVPSNLTDEQLLKGFTLFNGIP